ncbi:hypothetical protein ACVI1K_001805 [Bradyrhizobium sp. USDA 4508]
MAFTPCNGECRQSRRDLHLHVDRAGFNPLECDGGNALDHAAPILPQSKVAEPGGKCKNITGTFAAPRAGRPVPVHRAAHPFPAGAEASGVGAMTRASRDRTQLASSTTAGIILKNHSSTTSIARLLSQRVVDFPAVSAIAR